MEKISIFFVLFLVLFLFNFQKFWQKNYFRHNNASQIEKENVLKIEK